MIELFCGRASIAAAFARAGWEALAVDIVRPAHIPPGVQFIRADVTTLQPSALDFIWASPPCPEYSRHSMPWTRKKNPPAPDLTLWEFAARYMPGARRIIENVRGAQRFHGPAAAHWGPFYLWGDVPPEGMPLFGLHDMPQVEMRKKESYGSKDRAARAAIPAALADWIAQSVTVELTGVAA